MDAAATETAVETEAVRVAWETAIICRSPAPAAACRITKTPAA